MQLCALGVAPLRTERPPASARARCAHISCLHAPTRARVRAFSRPHVCFLPPLSSGLCHPPVHPRGHRPAPHPACAGQGGQHLGVEAPSGEGRGPRRAEGAPRRAQELQGRLAHCDSPDLALPILFHFPQAQVFDAALEGGGAKNINFQELAADLAQITFDYPFR